MKITDYNPHSCFHGPDMSHNLQFENPDLKENVKNHWPSGSVTIPSGSVSQHIDKEGVLAISTKLTKLTPIDLTLHFWEFISQIYLWKKMFSIILCSVAYNSKRLETTQMSIILGLEADLMEHPHNVRILSSFFFVCVFLNGELSIIWAGKIAKIYQVKQARSKQGV